MTNYIQIINNYGELYSKMGKMLSLAGGLSNRQHRWPLCWHAAYEIASTDGICAGGLLKEPPALMALCAGGLCWRAGLPPAQRAISTSSKLLAGDVPASKDRF
jgi:hypothetical protein